MIDELLVIKINIESHYDIKYNKFKKDILDIINTFISDTKSAPRIENQFSFDSFNFKDVKRFDSRITNILDFIWKNYYNNITLTLAANKCYMSKCYFERVFSSQIGISFKKFLNIFRIYKAAEKLRLITDIAITKVCYDVGFNDLSNFITQFKNAIGCSPKKFMKCALDPEKCIIRGKSFLFEKEKNITKINAFIGYPIKYMCYIGKHCDIKINDGLVHSDQKESQF